MFLCSQVPPSERFDPSKNKKSSSWWSWLGFGSASNTVSTDYEGVTDEGLLTVIQYINVFIM